MPRYYQSKYHNLALTVMKGFILMSSEGKMFSKSKMFFSKVKQ